MGRKISITRLVLCFAIAVALLVSLQAGPVAAGMSGMGCAGGSAGAGDASPAKQSCPKNDSSCITLGRCAIGCAAETPFPAAASSMASPIAASPYLHIRAMPMPSRALKPDPYPPRSRV